MKLFYRMSFCLLIVTVLGASLSFAQGSGQRASQRGHIEQTVAKTEIKVTYHRPNAKGRVLWGSDGLVPTGKVWRTGANEATVFEVTGDVTINGKALPAGKYSFYAIPGDDEWTLIFNKTWEQWGTQYSKDADALRVMSKPVMSEEFKESLAYMIEDVTPDSAVVVLAWGKARIPFTVSVAKSVPETK